MSFHPNMQSAIQGITVLGGPRSRVWSGAIADFWRVACTGEATGDYVSPVPRLVIFLEKEGEGDIELRLPGDGLPARPMGGDMHFIPAGMPLCARTRDLRGLAHLDIHFDLPVLAGRGVCPANCPALIEPRLGFSDHRLLRLAKLVAAECTGPDRSGALYCDGLIAAVAGALLEPAAAPAKRTGRLSPAQLRRVTAFIEENCHRTIRLQELAALAGLSESYFSAAFKASTGLPPHRWQMKARIGRVKAVLERRTMALAEVAAATGFSDQAHLTRVFRRVVGTTPAAWQRDRAA